MAGIFTFSYYTFLEGTISPDEIIGHAVKEKYPYAVLTDRNGMYGLIQFYGKAIAEGIKPILGCMIDDPSDKLLNAVFLAKNRDGYSEICRLITARKLNDEFSILTYLRNPSPDLFIISSSFEIIKLASEHRELKDNFYAGLTASKAGRLNNRRNYEYCKTRGIKFAAMNPVVFASPEDYNIHKTVTAIRLNKTISSLEPEDLADEEYCLQSKKDYLKVWKGLPEAIENTEYILNNCNADLEKGKYKFPNFPLPAGETSFSLLWKLCFRGLEEKYQPITDKAVSRLQYELQVINELGFSDYFLIVWDIIKEAAGRSMVTIGRGSAANSLAAYCLGITQVDPIQYNLYFERFLNKGRSTAPDTDIDFSWKDRDEIIKYVFEKYGYEKVAMISTKNTFRARSAFRETAKVFGIPDSEISKYSKKIPWTSAANLPGIAEKFPESKSLDFSNEPWKSIVETASKLSGFPRFSGIHPGGIVITKEPITNYVALEYAKNKGLGLIITQPDMYSIEEMGLIKIDLLAQRSLGVLRDTLEMIEASRKISE